MGVSREGHRGGPSAGKNCVALGDHRKSYEVGGKGFAIAKAIQKKRKWPSEVLIAHARTNKTLCGVLGC